MEQRFLHDGIFPHLQIVFWCLTVLPCYYGPSTLTEKWFLWTMSPLQSLPKIMGVQGVTLLAHQVKHSVLVTKPICHMSKLCFHSPWMPVPGLCWSNASETSSNFQTKLTSGQLKPTCPCANIFFSSLQCFFLLLAVLTFMCNSTHFTSQLLLCWAKKAKFFSFPSDDKFSIFHPRLGTSLYLLGLNDSFMDMTPQAWRR